MTLTPPADAPLPWEMDEDGDVIAANGEIVDIDDVLAAANAAPGLVAERDTALARVAELEVECERLLAMLKAAQALAEAWTSGALQDRSRIADALNALADAGKEGA